MRYGMRFTLLLLTAGLSLMPTGHLLADDGTPTTANCKDQLIRIEQRLADADIAAQKEAQIRQIIDGADARPVGRRRALHRSGQPARPPAEDLLAWPAVDR
ncbi:MAG: hypothetical protein ACREJ0_00915 [Geminicoccaceae bacterium]